MTQSSFLMFGELMLRLVPPGPLRLRQALPGPLQGSFTGAEANVAASLALLGARARFLTALPEGPLADCALASVTGLGIDTGMVVRRKAGRLGIYFVEGGANQRGAGVIYDRESSAISLARPEEYDFARALDGVTWVHLTGITPALSQSAYEATLALAQAAKEKRLMVSCDLNFRKKLWCWRSGTSAKELARECMSRLLPLVDLVVANEEDAADVLDIHAAGSDVDAGTLSLEGYAQVARQLVARFDNLRYVAITLRQSISADHNNWGGMLFDAAKNQVYVAPRDAGGNYRPYEIRDIVDRVGAGDSFSAGLLFALNTPELADPQLALRFAVAASCLKHSVLGDFNYVTREEIEALMGGSATGRVRR